MTRPTVIFSHGQESGPWGTKIRAMAATVEALGCKADSIDYQGIADPGERVDKLKEACAALDAVPAGAGFPPAALRHGRAATPRRIGDDRAWLERRHRARRQQHSLCGELQGGIAYS